MSNIEDRIVRMKFDNAQFEEGVAQTTETLKKFEDTLKLEGASNGLGKVQSAINSVSMSPITNAAQSAGEKFNWLREMGIGALRDIGARIERTAETMAKKMTIQPLIDGFNEYQTQMDSIQTIMANTGRDFNSSEDIKQVNDALDELNTYADKTIYNFTEMTRNIGTFTAAGVSLETAVPAIQGVANLAAVSGANAQKASNAMYQLSQALSTGSLKLQDWNSVVNAGMGGQVFQEALKRTARAHGIAVDEMIEKAGSFRESLKSEWITSEVLTDTLNQLAISYDEVGDATYEKAKKTLMDHNYSEEDAVAILELAKTAEEAATKVRTWNQLWSTVGEALGSGWTTTWRLIIGDFKEATDVFTYFSDILTGIIEDSSNARNAVFQDWHDNGGRDALFGSLVNIIEAIRRPLAAIVDAFGRVFSISGADLAIATENFARFTEKLVLSEDAANKLGEFFEGLFTILHAGISIVFSIGRAIGTLAGIAWNLIKPFATLVGSGIMKGLDILVPLFNNIADTLDDVTSDVTPLIEVFQTLSDKVIEFFKGLKPFSGIGDLVGKGIGALKDFISPKDASLDILKEIGNKKKGALELTDWFKVVNSGNGGEKFQEQLKEVARAHGVAVDEIIKKNGSFKDSLKDGWLTADIFNETLGILEKNTKGYGDAAKEAASKFASVDFMSFINGIKNSFKSTDTFMHGLGDSLLYISRSMPDWLGPVKEAFRSLGVSFLASRDWYSAFYSILDKAPSVLKPFADALSWVIHKIDRFVNYAKAIKEVFDHSGLLGVFTDFEHSLDLAFERNKIPKNLKPLADAFHDFVGEFKHSGSIIKSFKKVAVNAFNDVKAKATSTFDTFKKKLDEFKGVKPKESIEGVSKALTDSLVPGLKETAEKAPDATSTLQRLAEKGGKALTDLKNTLGGWKESISQYLSGALQSFGSFLVNLPLTIADGIRVFGGGLAQFIQNLKEIPTAIKESGVDVLGAIKELFPSPSDLGAGLRDKIDALGQWFHDALKGVFMGADKGETDALKANWLDFSDIEITFPDFKAPVLTFEDDIRDVLENFPWDSVDAFTERFGNFMQWLVKGMWIENLFWFLRSIRSVYKGVGKSGEGLGKALEGMPKFLTETLPKLGQNFGKGIGENLGKNILTAGQNIKEGLENIGRGTKALTQKKDIPTQLIKIATAIGILAGSLFIFMKTMEGHSSAEVMDAIKLLTVLVGAMSAVVIITGIVMDMASLDGSKLSNIGNAFVGLGVGVIAMVAALYGLTEYFKRYSPEEQINGVIALVAIAFTVGVLAFTMKNVDFKGLGAAAIGMAVAMVLLLVPIKVLANMGKKDPTKLQQGLDTVLWLLIGMGATIALASRFSAGKGAMLALGACALAFSVAITLLLIPVEILGHTKSEVIENAEWALLFLLGVLDVAIILGTNFAGGTGAIYALGACAIALALAVNLLMIPVVVLSMVPAEQLGKSLEAVEWLIVIMGLVIALVNLTSELPGGAARLATLALSFIALAVAVDLLVAGLVVLSALAFISSGALETAVDSLIYAVMAFALIEVLGAMLGPGLIKISAAFVVFGIAVAALAVGLLALEAVNITGISDQLKYLAIALVIFVAAAVLLSPIAPIALMVAGAIALLGVAALAVSAGIYLFSQTLQELGATAPEQMSVVGQAIGQGFAASLLGFAEGLVGIGGMLIDKLIEGIGNKMQLVWDAGKQFLDWLTGGMTDNPTATQNTGEQIKNDVAAGASGTGEAVAKEVGKAPDDIMATLASKQGVLQGAGETIKKEVSTGASGLTDDLMNKMLEGSDGLAKVVEDYDFESVGGKIDEEVVNKGLGQFVPNMEGVSTDGSEAFLKKLSEANYPGAGESIDTNVLSGLSSFVGDMSNSGNDGAAGFINALASPENLQAAYDSGFALGAQSKQGTQDALDEHSPSKVMYQTGVFAVRGFVNAFSDNLSMAYSAGATMADQIPKSFADTLNANPIGIEELFDTDYNPVITPVIDSTVFDGGFSELSDMLRFNNSAFSLNGYFDGVDLRGLSDLGTIETSNRELIGEIKRLRTDLQGYTEAASSAGLYIDGDVLVGELAPRMDDALGQRAALAERGVY